MVFYGKTCRDEYN